MIIEFRKAILPGELDELLAFDRRIFGSFPKDLFEPTDWLNYESFWMYVDGVKVGCSALEHDVDYDELPRAGCLYIASTGVLGEFQGRGFGRAQKEWQVAYARDRGARAIVTNMRESNDRMIRLNRTLGFKFRCRVADYYESPDEAAIVMELSLE